MIGTLIVVACVLLWPAPINPSVLPAASSSRDLMMSHWPTALLIKRTVAQEHRLPLWDPTEGGGRPMIADPLATIFYPPTQLVNLLSLRNYYLALLLGHLVLAGLGMYLLARRALGLSLLAALTAAVSFMATPRLISHLGAGHVTLVQTVAWYPWLALTCWATVRRPRRYGPLLALCVALLILAGHPQMAYYGLLMVGGLAVWLLTRRWRDRGRRAALTSLLGLAAAGALGVLLASVHLIPLLELTAHSTRQVSLASQDRYRLVHFLEALAGREAPSTVPWEGMLQPGLAVLALAIFGIATRWRKGLPLLLGVIAVAALTMGQASPIFRLAARVLPDLDLFRGLARIWFVALVGIALLAGLGTEAIINFVRRRLTRAGLAAGLICVLLVATTLSITDHGYARVATVQPATTPNALERAAEKLAGNGRIYGAQRNVRQTIAADLGARLADGWNPLLIESYVRYMQTAGGYRFSGYQLTIPPYQLDSAKPAPQPDARLLGLMDVSVVLSRTRLTDPRLVQVSKIDGTRIYRNTADLGPGYLVGAAPDGSPPALDQLQPIAASIRTIHLSAERDIFAFTAPSAGYFVVATPAYPGWIATFDGRRVSAEAIGGALPAIRVGPGAHTLTYSYQPRSLRLGVILSVIGLALLVGWAILTLRSLSFD